MDALSYDCGHGYKFSPRYMRVDMMRNPHLQMLCTPLVYLLVFQFSACSFKGGQNLQG